jgi:hypothetical protein
VRKLGEDGNEHSRVIISGKEYTTFTSREPGHVKFEEDVVSAIDTAPENSVKLIHNHPLNSPPSWSDLKFMYFPSVAECQVVGSDGRVYAVALGSGERPTPEEFLRQVELLDGERSPAI